MVFSSIEKQSIISLMVGIIEADGWIDDEEIEFAEEVLDAIDCSEDDFDLGQEMPLLPALVTIKNMTPEQKETPLPTSSSPSSSPTASSPRKKRRSSNTWRS